jgi:hypothetical protein
MPQITPTISEHDRTLLAADDIVRNYESMKITPDTRHKLEHARIIQQLKDVLHRYMQPPPRVAPSNMPTQAPPRVVATNTPPLHTDPAIRPTVSPITPTQTGQPPRVTAPMLHPTAKQSIQQTRQQYSYNTTRAITPPDAHLGDVTINNIRTQQQSLQRDHATTQQPSAQIALLTPRPWSNAALNLLYNHTEFSWAAEDATIARD